MLSVDQKIYIACQLNRALRMLRRIGGHNMRTTVSRRGVRWALDLDEGIDLSIYLLGAYEPRTLRAYQRLIRPGAVVFDIGANIGAHTLHFARLTGKTGRVFAFEPTDFACAKLRANLALNPQLAPQVEVQQVFLVADSTEQAPPSIAASWPVSHQPADLNAWHGKSHALGTATATTADDFCDQAGVSCIDFVKLDVDGHENAVLRGFRRNLARFRPIIIVELAPFVYKGTQTDEFNEFIRFLVGLDYDFTDAYTGHTVSCDPDELRRTIKPGGIINALLLPRSR